jgi:hypothetical protein
LFWFEIEKIILSWVDSEQAFKWTISIVILVIVGLTMAGVGREVMHNGVESNLERYRRMWVKHD